MGNTDEIPIIADEIGTVSDPVPISDVDMEEGNVIYYLLVLNL